MGEYAASDEAVNVAPLVSPGRLVLARELKGWTQREVVERLDEVRPLSTAALSQMERGHTRPSPPTLAALAEVYGCPPEFFVDRPDDRDPEGFFRSLRSTPARDRKQYLARARLLHDFVRVAEDHLQLPEVILPDVNIGTGSEGAVEAAAAAVRSRWQLKPGPIDNVVTQLEHHGIVVVRSQQFTEEVDAFSVCFDDRPIVVLGAAKNVTARSRFDAAHELGHLVMHGDDDAGTKVAETQAHQFAAAFLMPAEDIGPYLPDRMDLRALQELKVTWRVSIQALLKRAKTLGAMTPDRYTSAMKMISTRGWRTQEPGDHLLGPVENPRLLASLVDRLAEIGTSVEHLCAAGSLPSDEVQALILRTSDSRPRLRL